MHCLEVQGKFSPPLLANWGRCAPQVPASGKVRDEGAPGERSKVVGVQGYVGLYFSLLYCAPKNPAGVSATGKIRLKIKFAAFCCVLLTKIKVDPESW